MIECRKRINNTSEGEKDDQGEPKDALMSRLLWGGVKLRIAKQKMRGEIMRNVSDWIIHVILGIRQTRERIEIK